MKNPVFEKLGIFLYEAEQLLQSRKLPEAFSLAMERLNIFPHDADAYVVLCSVLIAMGKIGEAREALTEWGEIISNMSRAYERIGDVFRQKGFYQDAADCYEKLLALHPEAQKAREIIEKMSTLSEQDNPAQPEDDLQIIFEKNISEPELMTLTMADLYIQQGHFPEAIKILQEIIAKDPQNQEAIQKLDFLKSSLFSDEDQARRKQSREKTIQTLSLWLKNIERLRTNASGRE